MNVIWTPEAEQDRYDIFDYIAMANVVAAIEMDEAFLKSSVMLGDFPMMGHKGEAPSTLEIFPHPNYRMIYAFRDNTVWILALVHTARKWPLDQ
ncbi:type II toxin-antitoxin system RelE/ParE family toxin [Salmonella enterica]|uniref:Type II toxin-antitoxin system mRNA interferase toxin, RelE/StbE family n=2 Tax=Salmonella enterica TaxID=28901 RepID=A0A633DG95_SALER|nr:type II toxin-antitoxin system RelE/ParE family toxin [Salmonella enterica]EBW2601687.1 type II toxin-antitoxin system RelE/ParE family toxin [Salmonella enterica subsp. enterica serovar Poano]EBZ5136749.1 type II toxin-antitoxin system RelE/ParE family toxin [Salmonella enterica subsp. enterica serovar Antsalova]ECD6161613.1 type II toxin-antitoxin system RelE/ParE family toxin [Salmonella enterica subsp. enterica]ECU7994273.1 type II toxin-antitoxin system RelE/ParE family toxin [Salmonell